MPFLAIQGLIEAVTAELMNKSSLILILLVLVGFVAPNLFAQDDEDTSGYFRFKDYATPMKPVPFFYGKYAPRPVGRPVPSSKK